MDNFTVSQASTYCRVPRETIINWLDTGRLRVLSSEGGHRLIAKEDLDRVLRDLGFPLPVEMKGDGRKKILVVDDDRIIVETLVQALEEDEYGYDVYSAADGFEARLQTRELQARSFDSRHHDAQRRRLRGVQVDQEHPGREGDQGYRAFRLSRRRGIRTDADVRRRCMFLQTLATSANEV